MGDSLMVVHSGATIYDVLLVGLLLIAVVVLVVFLFWYYTGCQLSNTSRLPAQQQPPTIHNHYYLIQDSRGNAIDAGYRVAERPQLQEKRKR